MSKSDKNKIKEVLETESATWRSGDKATHADCWNIQPYSKILISTTEGEVLDIPPVEMINPSSDEFGQGGSSENSNYLISIVGNAAWVSHDEVSYDTQGNAKRSKEIRILEKINDQWKLVGQSIHFIP